MTWSAHELGNNLVNIYGLKNDMDKGVIVLVNSWWHYYLDEWKGTGLSSLVYRGLIT